MRLPCGVKGEMTYQPQWSLPPGCAGGENKRGERQGEYRGRGAAPHHARAALRLLALTADPLFSAGEKPLGRFLRWIQVSNS